MGGYGTDQALLRFAANRADKAAVSVLGLFPVNMMRNVNQYRHLRTEDSPHGFKPRFVVEGDSLRLIPKPDPTYAELLFHLDGTLKTLLPYEAFEPGTRVGPVPFEFPFTLTLARLLVHDQVKSWLLDRPSWIDFLDTDHPSQARQVTTELCDRFVKQCDARGKECFVLLLPTPSSYDYFRTTGALVMEPLMLEFSKRNIPHLNLTTRVSKALAARPFAEILTNKPHPGMGHFNAEGNRMVAQFVFDYLAEADMLAGD